VAVIDVFDSLTHARVYKRAWTTEEALDEVENLAGTKFDPTVARAFLRIHGRMPAGTASDTLHIDED
jgi:putative two-component system response regulator